MTYRKRTYYTDRQKALMWERWKAGWTLHEIGHLFDRRHPSIQGILSSPGRGPPRPPEAPVAGRPGARTAPNGGGARKHVDGNAVRAAARRCSPQRHRGRRHRRGQWHRRRLARRRLRHGRAGPTAGGARCGKLLPTLAATEAPWK